MKANETRIDKFMASNETTFAIPVYQRNYDWTKVQCQQLFKDIISVGADNSQNAHFIGSIVYVHDDVYSSSSLTELTIIDGQQRLTTLTLIYVSIYRHALKTKNESLAQRIYENYLINKFTTDVEKLKLKPTDNNKSALSSILDPQESVKITGFSRLVDNFRLFQNLVEATDIEILLRGMSKLIFVDIALDRQKDNPQRIFESLNSTGLELSQADLIRNYILMGLPRAAQEDLFRKFWEPIEANARNETTNESRVSDFIRDYLTLKQKEIPNKGAVYEKFKQRFPVPNSEFLRDSLDEIRVISSVYNKILNPFKEPDLEIRREMSYINLLEVNVTYPFLMQVYQDFVEEKIDKSVFVSILRLIQSFVWRRFIVGLPTSVLNKIFMTLYDRVEPDNYLYSVQRSLAQRPGVSRFPTDAEVIANLKEKDMYNTKSKTRSYFFDRIENHNNNEFVEVGLSSITIEHIFPQNPDAAWINVISREDFAKLSDELLNTIGNLTLSGNNGKLGNRTFADKKEMNVDGGEQGYRFSRLWLNRDLKDCDSWGVSEVMSRAESIAARCIEIWPMPDVKLIDDEESDVFNIFDADDPRYRKLEYAIFFGNKFSVTQVAKLYVEVFRQLIDLQPEAFFGTKLGERIQLTDDKDLLRNALQVSDLYFIEGNIDSTSKFERIKAALSELGVEDELAVKYA